MGTQSYANCPSGTHHGRVVRPIKLRCIKFGLIFGHAGGHVKMENRTSSDFSRGFELLGLLGKVFGMLVRTSIAVAMVGEGSAQICSRVKPKAE